MSRTRTVGLAVLALLGLLDIAGLAGFVMDDAPPAWVLLTGGGLGLLTLIGVANPVLFDTWSAEPAQAFAINAQHHGAWVFTTTFLAVGFALSVPAVVLLAGLLDGALARIASSRTSSTPSC